VLNHSDGRSSPVVPCTFRDLGNATSLCVSHEDRFYSDMTLLPLVATEFQKCVLPSTSRQSKKIRVLRKRKQQARSNVGKTNNRHVLIFQNTLIGISQPVCATPNLICQYILYAHFLLTTVARDTDADQITISQSISYSIRSYTAIKNSIFTQLYLV
jgi:hypothetical protein